jgi:hypothetical protein
LQAYVRTAEEASVGQCDMRHLTQLASRLGLHAGGNLLAEELEQELGHG